MALRATHSNEKGLRPSILSPLVCSKLGCLLVPVRFRSPALKSSHSCGFPLHRRYIMIPIPARGSIHRGRAE
jgi:hypothetical protein